MHKHERLDPMLARQAIQMIINIKSVGQEFATSRDAVLEKSTRGGIERRFRLQRDFKTVHCSFLHTSFSDRSQFSTSRYQTAFAISYATFD